MPGEEGLPGGRRRALRKNRFVYRTTKRANLVIESPEGQRWEAGLGMLPEGATLLIGDLLLYLDPGKDLRPDRQASLVVDADASRWWHEAPKPERETRAREQLTDARTRFDGLLQQNPTLAKLAQDRTIRYELVDDYGDGAVLLATLTNDNFEFQSPSFRP